MGVLKGFGVWLKGLPGQVGYFVAVPLVLVGLAILAGFVVHSHVPVWALLAALAVGLVAGAGLVHILSQEDRSALDELAELQKEAAELQPYPTYANHLRDALDLLRKVAMGELPSFSLRDFVEAGVFQPAHVLLTKGATRGDVRFSILHVDGDKFYMSKGGELLPALGHRPQSRGRRSACRSRARSRSSRMSETKSSGRGISLMTIGSSGTITQRLVESTSRWCPYPSWYKGTIRTEFCQCNRH